MQISGQQKINCEVRVFVYNGKVMSKYSLSLSYCQQYHKSSF